MSSVKPTPPRAGQTDDSEELPSRYIVGIDLGTTNSAVSFLDTASEHARPTTFPIPQVVAPGQVENRSTLPSFHYQGAEGELPAGSFRLPWSGADPSFCVGVFARDHGTAVPGRMINSAKSWLSHSGVDRTAPLLPWHGAADLEKLSPVEVSARLLGHIRAAWNHAYPGEPLERQDIVLTLPASFDEIARELTVQAAAKAGLARIFLIEEPQAAFYDWLSKHADDWQQRVSPGQTILVCDIGGGTSDFTLIRARADEQEKVQFHRVAVGEHLILGGDNLDLALAKHLEHRLTGGGELPADRWSVLVRRARQIKEQFLQADAPETLTVNLPAAGAKLIGGGMQCEVAREEVERLLLEGFLPRARLSEGPETRTSGFQEFGLPYAPDAAMTRWLADFLRRHVQAIDPDAQTEMNAVRPDIILFNGGFFESPVLRARLIEVLTSWFQTDTPGWKPLLLENRQLDLAVAQGAAYYGRVRRGEGVRIASNLARTYYIGVGNSATGVPQALCLLPATIQPGEEVDLTEKTFELRISEPVEFPLYISSTRLIDRAGQIVPVDPKEIKSLPPIRTVLRVRRRHEATTVQVRLHARLSEIGTIELWCGEVDTERTWRLQFDVRSATQTDVAAHVSAKESEGFFDEEHWTGAMTLLEDTFLPDGHHKPQKLLKEVEEALEMPRAEWPTSLLRRMWEKLMDLEPGRRRSSTHEARWLNLTGFSLRPGYGLALDDWRVSETWKALQGKVAHNDDNCKNQSAILWRRIAGGLTRGQQQALAEPILVATRSLHRRQAGGRPGAGQGNAAGINLSPEQAIEPWRLLGSLERLDARQKIEIGNMLIDLIGRKKLAPARSAMAWTIGRLGSRTPLYGPLNTVVPKGTVAQWLAKIYALPAHTAMDRVAVMLLARRTDDRYRDLGESPRQKAAEWLTEQNAPPHFAEIVREGGLLDEEQQREVFGESLPTGLTLVS
ncbi:MAG: Hsp70 family protein [Pirellulaceae bacterium]